MLQWMSLLDIRIATLPLNDVQIVLTAKYWFCSIGWHTAPSFAPCSQITSEKFLQQLHMLKTSMFWVVVLQMWVYRWFHLHTARNDGRRGGNLPDDATTSVEGYTHSPDTNEYTTLTPMTPTKTGSPGVTEVTIVGDSTSKADLTLPGNLAIWYLVCFLYRKKQHILSYGKERLLCGDCNYIDLCHGNGFHHRF